MATRSRPSRRPDPLPHSGRKRSDASATGSRVPPGGGTVARAPQEVRIIGGRLKRSPLSVPLWPGLRPTPARVRETLFNWLGQDLTGWRVLDAFAGSGALGLEAASRGAAPVWMLEREAVLASHIRASVQRLGVQGVTVHAADALSWMKATLPAGAATGFDLVMLDPPFHDDLFDQALALAVRCTVPGGWIYLEAPRPVVERAVDAPPSGTPVEGAPIVLPDGLFLHRHGKAGAVHFHLIGRRVEGEG